MCTRQSRKVIWDMINTLFLKLQLSNLALLLSFGTFKHGPWPLVPFFQISLKNSELKTTHNTFRDCRVHFFRQLSSKQLYPAISRKVVAKNVHATIPKCNIYFFCCFPLALTKIFPWPFVPFFQISLKNSSELKSTHNIFRDCRD